MKPFFVKMQDFMQKYGNFFDFGCNFIFFSLLSDLVEVLIYEFIDLDGRNKKEKNVIDFSVQIH